MEKPTVRTALTVAAFGVGSQGCEYLDKGSTVPISDDNFQVFARRLGREIPNVEKDNAL